MSTFSAILYDAGRTLLRPRPDVPEIWEFLEHQLGVTLERDRQMPDVGHFYYARLGQDGMGAYDSDARARSFWSSYYFEVLADAGVGLAEEELAKAGNAVYDWFQQPEQWEPYPETLEALDRAHDRGLTQGVVSDWGTELVRLLHAHQVTQHMDFVVASAAVGTAKPHPDIFRYALGRADLDPSEVLYVGDSYISDVLGARAVGIEGVLLDRERRAPALDCQVVHSLVEVLNLVEITA